MKLNILTIIAMSTLLIGCGSSSSGDSSEKDDKEVQSEVSVVEETVTETVTETQPAVAIKNIEYIQGIYDISNGEDIVYLSIDGAGEINTYDYQGDSVDNGLNCYVKNLATGFNQELNGLTVTNDETAKQFTANGYNWYYGDDTNISKVAIGGISAGGMLGMNNIRIATSKYLTTNVTLEEIKQSICE